MEKFDVSAWKQARNNKHLAREERRKDLLNNAKQEIFQFFSAIPTIKSVYLTGSILQPNKFHKYSDIDIAVEGLEETSYLRTKVELEKLLNITVDLIELENCRFRDIILENGIKII